MDTEKFARALTYISSRRDDCTANGLKTWIESNDGGLHMWSDMDKHETYTLSYDADQTCFVLQAKKHGWIFVATSGPRYIISVEDMDRLLAIVARHREVAIHELSSAVPNMVRTVGPVDKKAT